MAMKLGSPEDVEDRRACQRWASQCMNSDLGFVYISENDNPIKWEGHMTDEEMRRYGWTRRRILAHCQAVTRSVLANRISGYSIGDKPIPIYPCLRAVATPTRTHFEHVPYKCRYSPQNLFSGSYVNPTFEISCGGERYDYFLLVHTHVMFIAWL